MHEGRPIAVAVTEWNTTGGDWGPPRGQLWNLANALACSRYHNLIHRHCDLVQIACRSNLVNSFCSGCIQTDNHRLYKTPTYYAQQLYATLAGDRPLRIDSTLPASAGPDLSATLSPNGDAVILFAVNDALAPITRPLDFSAFAGDGSEGHRVVVWTLSDTKERGRARRDEQLCRARADHLAADRGDHARVAAFRVSVSGAVVERFEMGTSGKMIGE